ncbi:UNVERIFIED_CONTAM: ribbon-helix-helix CopG family protein [Acetivibrio alkalicellulosi]
MISVRLSKELEEKIDLISKQENISKTDILKEAIKEYIIVHEKKQNPYDLGEDLFGKHGSEKGDLSQSYKKKVREKINEKMSY